MLDPREILKALFHTFDQSARSDLQRFIAAQSGITKWMIAANFAFMTRIDRMACVSA